MRLKIRQKILLPFIFLWIASYSLSLKAEAPDPEIYPNLMQLLNILVKAVMEGEEPHNFNYHWDFTLIADDELIQPAEVVSSEVAVKLASDIDFILKFDEISEQHKREISEVLESGLSELESYLGEGICQSYSFEQDINLGIYGYKLWHQYFICPLEHRFHFEYGHAG